MNELTTTQNLGAVVARTQDPIAAIERMGAWFAKSGLFGCDRQEQGQVLALTCITEGLSPVEFDRTYHLVSGRISKKSMAAHAEFRKLGGKVRWLATGDDGQKASAEFTFDGQTVMVTYTIDQAKSAGLVKPNSGWTKNTGNMLRARVLSNGLGMLCPEIYAGEYDDETPAQPAPEIKLTTVDPPLPYGVDAVQDAKPPEPTVVDVPATVVQPAAEYALSDDLQVQLVAAIGTENLPAATEYVRKLTWISATQDLISLPENRARQIIAKAENFKAAIKGGGK